MFEEVSFNGDYCIIRVTRPEVQWISYRREDGEDACNASRLLIVLGRQDDD